MKETPVLNKIMSVIGCLPGLRIWRNNTGMLWGGDIIKIRRKQQISVVPGDIVIKDAYPVKFGLEGSADIIGIIAPDGRFFALEAKGRSGRQSDQQKKFEQMINTLGGVYLLAHSPEEALEKVNNLIKSS